MTIAITQTDAATARRLGEVLSTFMAQLKQLSAGELMQLMRREELSLPRMVALIYVDEHGAASITQLSEHLNLALGTTSQVVDQLVCAGFAARTENPHDRRHKQVTLTPKGGAVVAEFRRLRAEELARHLSELPAPLLAQTLAVMEQVTAYLARSE
jgi:DNA-binding MarR family transcriptional regulator